MVAATLGLGEAWAHCWLTGWSATASWVSTVYSTGYRPGEEPGCGANTQPRSAAVPVIVAMLAVGAYEAVHRGSVATIGWALVAFAGINLPGLAFVAAFALLMPLVISAPLFRVLFIGYWFWGNLVNPSMLPTLTGSLLTPLGDYAASGLFGTDRLYASWPGPLQFLRPHLSTSAGVAEIALLVIVAGAVLVVGQLLFARRNRA